MPDDTPEPPPGFGLDPISLAMKEAAKPSVTLERVRAAVNAECTCGGRPAASSACPACMVWHRLQK